MRISGFISALVLYTITMGCAPASFADESKQCRDLVRFDDSNSRLFIVCPELPSMTASEIRSAIRDIFEAHGGPPDEYFISFFASRELAGYKDDPCCESSIASGEWARSYVGEFYTHSNEVTLWPALPAKRRVLELWRQDAT